MAAIKISRFVVGWMLIALLGLAALALTPGLASATSHAQTPPADPGVSGERLYAENCAVCHGLQGQGRVGATLAKDWPSIRPDLTVKTIIENGVPGSVMPAWSQAKGGPLTPAEINALTQYILSWQTGGAAQVSPQPTATLIPPITPLPNVQGDPNRGARLFGENCVVCHGGEGQGRIGATLAKNWPGVRPDLNLRNTIARGISGSQMPAWSRSNGGPLSEQDIDDLVAYILHLSQTNPVTLVSPAPQQFVPPGESPFSGWLGVLVFLALLIVVIAAAVGLQKRKS